MPCSTASVFVTEHDIRQIASGLNINRHHDDQSIRCGLFTITAGDLRRLCTTAFIGARLIDASQNFAFAHGFTHLPEEPGSPPETRRSTNARPNLDGDITMPCQIELSTIPGHKTDFSVTFEIMGKSLARKSVDVSTVADVKCAVTEFGAAVREDHPDDSFYISVSIRKGSRKPNGFDAAEKYGGLGQHDYMTMKGTVPCAVAS